MLDLQGCGLLERQARFPWAGIGELLGQQDPSFSVVISWPDGLVGIAESGPSELAAGMFCAAAAGSVTAGGVPASGHLPRAAS